MNESILIDKIFCITPIRYKKTGYVECKPEDATFWSVYHYQTNAPRYGEGWFPAHLFDNTPDAFGYMYKTLEKAKVGLEVYRRAKQILEGEDSCLRQHT